MYVIYNSKQKKQNTELAEKNNNDEDMTEWCLAIKCDENAYKFLY